MRLELANVLAIHEEIVHGAAQDDRADGRKTGGKTGQTTPTEADQQ
jgi:hypothetical protein